MGSLRAVRPPLQHLSAVSNQVSNSRQHCLELESSKKHLSSYLLNSGSFPNGNKKHDLEHHGASSDTTLVQQQLLLFLKVHAGLMDPTYIDHHRSILATCAHHGLVVVGRTPAPRHAQVRLFLAAPALTLAAHIQPLRAKGDGGACVVTYNQLLTAQQTTSSSGVYLSFPSHEMKAVWLQSWQFLGSGN